LKVKTSRRKKGKAAKGSEASYSTKAERRLLEEESQLKKELSFFGRPCVKVIIFAAILLSAFAIRFSSTQAIESRSFMSDDEYWHLHIVNQIQAYGYRPNIDSQSWIPVGREMVHPPVYHYLIYLLSNLSGRSVFDVMFYIGPFVAALGIVAWFLLCRELYGTFGGLIGASVYAVLPITVAPTAVGAARPQALAEVVCALGMWLFFYAYLRRSKVAAFSSGVVFGFASLTWESTLYLYIPLILLFYLFHLVSRKATRQDHLVCLLTLSISLGIALTWYLPVFMRYGLWGNTPSFMLEATATFWKPELWFTIYCQLIANHVFYAVAFVTFPFLLIYTLFLKRELSQDYLALVFMSLGLIGLLFFGQRIIGATIGFGILLVFVSLFAKAWKVGFIRSRIILASLLCVLLIGSGAYTVYMASYGAVPYFKITGLLDLEPLIGREIPLNSSVVCWVGDSAFLLGHGLRTYWDGYLEHMPPWTRDRANEIVSVYLAKTEAESLQILGRLNASFVLARRSLTYPDQLQLMLKACNINAKPEDYFNFTAVKETRPKFIKDPVTGEWVFSKPLLFEEVVVGYEFTPTDKGRELTLARLVWNNETGNLLEHFPMPEPLEHFKLIWKSGDGEIMLYKVIYP